MIAQNPGRILIVDDEELSRELLQLSLEAEGHQIVLAGSGEKALEIIHSQPPDLVLTDVRMHSMSGYELCAAIKAEESTWHIPVLIYTGLNSVEDKQEGIAAGADDFIRKPLDLLIMLNRVRTLLRLKRAYDQLYAQNTQLENALLRYLDPETTNQIMADLRKAQSEQG